MMDGVYLVSCFAVFFLLLNFSCDHNQGGVIFAEARLVGDGVERQARVTDLLHKVDWKEGDAKPLLKYSLVGRGYCKESTESKSKYFMACNTDTNEDCEFTQYECEKACNNYSPHVHDNVPNSFLREDFGESREQMDVKNTAQSLETCSGYEWDLYSGRCQLYFGDIVAISPHYHVDCYQLIVPNTDKKIDESKTSLKSQSYKVIKKLARSLTKEKKMGKDARKNVGNKRNLGGSGGGYPEPEPELPESTIAEYEYESSLEGSRSDAQTEGEIMMYNETVNETMGGNTTATCDFVGDGKCINSISDEERIIACGGIITGCNWSQEECEAACLDESIGSCIGYEYYGLNGWCALHPMGEIAGVESKLGQVCYDCGMGMASPEGEPEAEPESEYEAAVP